MFETKKHGIKGGRPTIILEEHHLRWAMEFSQSNGEAAEMLNVDARVYNRWAKKYIDKESGKTFFDLHYPGHTGNHTGHSKSAIPLDDIFTNKHPLYPDYRLKRRLMKEGLKDECCEQCGFDEIRVTDKRIPLMLNFRDDDKLNKAFENLEILCLNCYFLLVGTPCRRRKADFE